MSQSIACPVAAVKECCGSGWSTRDGQTCKRTQGQKSAKKVASPSAITKMQEHMSKPRLKRWHKLENVYTKNFSKTFVENSSQWAPHARVNGPPMRVSMDPPPPRRKRHCAPVNGPLPSKETWPGPLMWGGAW